MSLIFRKQFFWLTAGLIVSFLLVAMGVIQAFNAYFYSQKESEMLSQASSVSYIYQGCFENDRIDVERFTGEIRQVSMMLDNSFIVYDRTGRIIWQSYREDSAINLDKLEEINGVPDVLSGKTINYTSDGEGFFTEDMFVVGVPIEENDEVVGAVFLKTSTSPLRETTYGSYRIIVIFMCVAIILNFIIIYLSSKNLSRPLQEMSAAAKVIAQGNFEKRLDISSDDEIGDLANSFNEMARSLHTQEKRRRDFISDISHDLRSPLTSMRGFLQAILDGTIPMEKQSHYLQVVLFESERLARLANDILESNKLEDKNTLELSEFNIVELLNQSRMSFEGRIVQEGINIVTNYERDNITVRADYEKIQRVVYNLVDNAFKFTNPGGIIALGANVANGKVYVSVSDNGAGIPKEEQKYVFDRLYKTDKTRGKDKKGSGLGLSIVRELVRAHNEEITLNSRVGKGSVFTFTLPYVRK